MFTKWSVFKFRQCFGLIPSLARSIILVARLKQSGFTYHIVDDNIHSFMSRMFLFEARPTNGIYELNLDFLSNNNFIYHAKTKMDKCNFY